MARSGRKISEMGDGDLAHRWNELHYRMIECAMTPDHPITRANRARWTREYKQVTSACERRGLFVPVAEEPDGEPERIGCDGGSYA